MGVQALGFAHTHKQAPVAFLDEKWFYTTLRRQTCMLLPKGNNEEVEPIYMSPKILFRCYPVKVMYMGVVANPQLEHGFEGLIFMKRVSKMMTAQRRSYKTIFTVDVHVNDAWQEGSIWRELIADSHSIEDVLNLIKSTYDLDEYVADRLSIRFKSITKGGTNSIIV